MSNNRADYISLYDLLDWAKTKYYGNLTNTTYDFLALLNENNKILPIYEYHKGIKDRITKKEHSLNYYLKEINVHHGYQKAFDDDIPF